MLHSPTAQLGDSYRPVRSPRGTELSSQGWDQEAAMRMLMNSLDEEVAERPRDLVVQGSTARPVNDWACYDAVLQSLKSLQNDETLLIQSGEPVGIFKTQPEAPRVAIAGSSPAPATSAEGEFPSEACLARALFGQDAARSWTHIGSQQALHAEFETFAAIGRAHFGGNLAGKLIVSGGMGAAGGTQPLAAALAGAAFLGIDVDGEKIRRRIRTGACDFCVNSLDEALRILKNAVRQKQPVSVGLVANCAEILPELARRGVLPDILSDMTGADDLLNGYIPAGLTLETAESLRRANPEEYLKRARHSLAQHVQGMMKLEKLGAVTFDFGNTLNDAALESAGLPETHGWPGFVSTYLRAAFAKGKAPLRWVALSGDRRDIHCADDLLLNLFPGDAMLLRWVRLARRYVKFQGLPARVAWLGREQRAKYAERVNALVAAGEIRAPVVFARDQIICSPDISLIPEPGGIENASAKSRREFVENLLNAAPGACCASFHIWRRGGSSGCCRTSQAAVADGSARAAACLQNVLARDCSFGLIGRPTSDGRSTRAKRRFPVPGASFEWPGN